MMINSQAQTFLILTVLSLTYSLCASRIEALRLAVSERRVPNFLGTWTFAGAALLCGPYLAGLVAVVYAAAWPTFRRAKQPLGKYVYNATSVAVSCALASYTIHHLPPVVGLLGGVAVFSLANVALVALAISAAGEFEKLQMLRQPRAHAMELSTQLLGAVLAVGAAWHRPAALLALPLLLFGMHLSATRGEIRRQHAFDSGTGLWREDAWAVQARDVVNAGEHVAVILIDPERPRQHALVAEALRVLRPGDIRGRFGESQVVAASVVGAPRLGEVLCKRIRQRLAELDVQCVVGSSTAAAVDLDTMLAWATADVLARRAARAVLDP